MNKKRRNAKGKNVKDKSAIVFIFGFIASVKLFYCRPFHEKPKITKIFADGKLGDSCKKKKNKKIAINSEFMNMGTCTTFA